jgi:hypothetical protein
MAEVTDQQRQPSDCEIPRISMNSMIMLHPTAKILLQLTVFACFKTSILFASTK